MDEKPTDLGTYFDPLSGTNQRPGLLADAK